MAQHNCPTCKCQPEPERCPCESSDSCCSGNVRQPDKRYLCCKCHTGKTTTERVPCLSPFHKKPAQKCKCAGSSCCGNEDDPGGDKHCLCCSPTLDTTRFQIIICKNCGRAPAQPATKDRVVEGMGKAYESGVARFWEPGSSSTPIDAAPATLIIHEPVKEMGLYEAVEAFTKNYKTFVNGVAGWDAIMDAFNRERAARERGSK